MGRSNETFSKKEKEKKRKEKQKEKEERREERKANAQKGKPLEEQYAYVDENGNLTSTPPDPTKKKREIDVDNILLGAKPIIDEPKVIRLGMVTMFNHEKGYGFIRDLKTQESIFVHMNQLRQPIKEKDKVQFETEESLKGLQAVNVKITG